MRPYFLILELVNLIIIQSATPGAYCDKGACYVHVLSLVSSSLLAKRMYRMDSHFMAMARLRSLKRKQVPFYNL